MLNILDINNWWPRGRSTPAKPDPPDSLDAFGSEEEQRRVDPPFPVSRPLRQRNRLALILAAVILTAGGVTGYLVQKWRPFQVEAASASLTIESDPAGAEVISNGTLRGKTPLTLSVAPGEHAFQLVHAGRSKALRTVASAGAAVVHHVHFDSAPAADVLKKASLRIVTEPAKLRVAVDGVAHGVSPLVVEGLAAGTHKVQVSGTTGTIERRVDVAPGETASVILSTLSAPAKAAGPAAGWLTVTSPVALQIFEGTNIIGTSQSPKIMLPAGRHELQLANESLGFSDRRVIQVSAGASATIRVDLPNAPLSINALPWADVWVDGKRVGETPIGDHQVRLGTHEIVLRHPDFGERKQTVTVSLTTPARVSVDMRKPR